MENEAKCLVCSKANNETPLLSLIYQDKTYWVCPQHLPLLIHKPEQLVGLLPGAEKLNPYSE